VRYKTYGRNGVFFARFGTQIAGAVAALRRGNIVSDPWFAV